MDVDPANDRPYGCPGKDTAHRMSHDGTNDMDLDISLCLVHQPVKLNPVQITSLRAMYYFVITFRIRRKNLGISKWDVRSLLQERYGKNISLMWIIHFENFGVLYENMCQLKSLLERWMECYDTTRTAAYSLLNSGMDVDLLNENMGSGRGENKTRSMSQQESYDSDKRMDIDDGEGAAQFLNSMVSPHSKATTNKGSVPTCSIRNSHTGLITPCSYDAANSIESLYSAKLNLVNQSTEPNKKRMMSLEELKNFVNAFQKRKLELDVSLEDVCVQLGKLFGRYIPLIWIIEFERFNVFFEEMCELKPVLEDLLEVFSNLRNKIREKNQDFVFTLNRDCKTCMQNREYRRIMEKSDSPTVASIPCFMPAATLTLTFALSSTARDSKSSRRLPRRQVRRMEPVQGIQNGYHQVFHR